MPPLGGWVSWAYAALWWLLLAAALAATRRSRSRASGTAPTAFRCSAPGSTTAATAGRGWLCSTSARRRRGGRGSTAATGSSRSTTARRRGARRVIDTADGEPVTLRLAEPGGAIRDVSLPLGAEHVGEALGRAGFGARFMAGWTLTVILLANLLGIAASVLLFRGDRSNPVAALLALIPLAAATAAIAACRRASCRRSSSVDRDAAADRFARLSRRPFRDPDERRPARRQPALGPGRFLGSRSCTARARSCCSRRAAFAAIPRLKRTAAADQRQQLRWAMLGFGGTRGRRARPARLQPAPICRATTSGT